MRIRSVTAHAFGPLAGESLRFADGMTVVVGDNESAKSSWHAAVYAALCGRRRGKGRVRDDEQRFADLHQPWDRDDWLVTAEIVLDDGRRVEMRQELIKRVDCQARDLDLGTDISAEILHEGAPDAARWLGLDRSSFVATACVVQAQLLGVLESATGLQDYLQRAASTAGTDTTAAAAIGSIKEFEAEHVGVDRVNATKPLRRAVLTHERAVEALDGARERHVLYLDRVRRLDELRAEAGTADAVLLAHEAAAAERVAHELRRALDLVEALDARYGERPPVSAADTNALTRQVHEALALWSSRPAEPPATDPADPNDPAAAPSPPLPDGDLQPHDSVERADTLLTVARTRWEDHQGSEPLPIPAPAIAVPDGELFELAHRLRAPATPVATPTPARDRRPLARAVAGGVLVIVGVVLLATASRVAGVVAVLAGLGLAGVALAGAARRRPPAAPSHRESQAAAALRCAELGLPTDPDQLLAIPAARALAATREAERATWLAQAASLHGALGQAATDLAAGLVSRGVTPISTDPAAVSAATADYRRQCRQRQAARARADRQARADAAARVSEIAVACSLAADTPELAAAELVGWDERREAGLAALATEQQERAELAALLAGRTLEQLRAQAGQAAARARQLSAGADPGPLAAARAEPAPPDLAALRQEANAARSGVDTADGELRQLATTVGSVAEAEEALAGATAELDRVRELAATLERTREFLTTAQERVHRDIAPVLAETVGRWLPAVTEGRYAEVIVSPTDLKVSVRSPGSSRWRDADRLSYGTAEQIYLLLRVALADHLTRDHDTCPLILDDVTVHADSHRTRDILDLLHEIAAERQVILFTQEDQVASWSEEHLTSPAHRVHRLTPVAAS